MLDFAAIGTTLGNARAEAHLHGQMDIPEAHNAKLAQEIANLKILLMKKTCHGEAVQAQADALVDELRRVNPGNALFIKTGRMKPGGRAETRLGAIFPKAFDEAAIKIGLPNYKTHRVEAV